MKVNIHSQWGDLLESTFQQTYFQVLTTFLREEYRKHTVYPLGKHIFAAFDSCPPEAVKVVIIGQDPYHGKGQAHGLCFSVPEGIPSPPSLLNIFKELENDLGKPMPHSGNLERWTRQGVLLLNAILTVRARQPGSHQGKGWEDFTDAVIQRLCAQKKSMVFLLWGSYAQRKGLGIDKTQHHVLEAPHPSPFSANRGFFGCKHFSKANAFLQKHDIEPIDW